MSIPHNRHGKAILRGMVLLWFALSASGVTLWWLLHDPAFVRATPEWLQNASTHIDRFNQASVHGLPLRALSLRILVSRWLLGITAALLVAALVVCRERVCSLVRDFFTCPRHPLNYAVFRVMVFWQVFVSTKPAFLSVVTSLPNGLQFPPETGLPRWGPLAAWQHWPIHPITPATAEFGAKALCVASVFGMLGLFSRTSSLVTAILFFAVFGAKEWYGKVDHGHHLGWFCLIFAVSRCGDALSIDSLVSAWRRAGRGITSPPGKSVDYGLPMAFCMLLIGLIYFFPGFWKLHRSGLDWAFSDNLIRSCWLKWHMIGVHRYQPDGWQPLFRIDNYPWLSQLAAFSVLCFELSFVFLIFKPTTRKAGALFGIFFHTMAGFVRRGAFEVLRNCYVIFFDWQGMLAKLGRFLFRSPIVVTWNDESKWQRRMVAYLRLCDLLGAVTWHTEPARTGDRSWEGECLVSDKNQETILEPSQSRRSVPVRLDSAEMAAPAGNTAARMIPVVIVGSALTVAAIVTGCGRKMEAWPVACYPLFDGMSPLSYRTMLVEVVDREGSRQVVLPDDYRHRYGYRWNQLMGKIIRQRDEARRKSQMRLAWEVLAKDDPRLARASSIRFYTVESWTAPHRWYDPPGDPQLVYEFRTDDR